MAFPNLQKTSESKLLALTRLFVATTFLAAGASKLIVPEMTEAFYGQLREVGFPFDEELRLIVPIVEMITGYFLLLGRMTRHFAIVSILLMFIAVYVHMVIDNPNLFPFQPPLPVLPALIILLSSPLVLFGGGAWSKDLDIFEK